MFKRLLIANRGEVAVRVAQAAREMGIESVCVASEADLGSSWLETMDEVVCLGGSAPRDSYLKILRVVQAGVQTRCTAVHPGWGFLAENPTFAAMCAQHGMNFVGPPAGVMERLGRKMPAKIAMRAAGLEGIPGSAGLLADVEEAAVCAADVGYPVIIKADSGGGGRGMRLCHDEATLREAFPQASAEAQSAFGDGRLYLESYLTGGRHIEVQVLCDSFGNGVHLGERECSIQRSHQKLIEESPSPALSDAERQALGERAAQAAVSIGYIGAGTIEFLRDDDGKLFFMEMNARLQVEHPVSEMVSGVDLVKKQLEIAANALLGLTQEDIELSGSAVECRINAEDPAQNFRPTPGKLSTCRLATKAGPGTVRVDTHLSEGDSVPPYYDSLIAKVIAHGKTRDAAIDTMIAALRDSEVEGVKTTIPLHLAVLDSDEFRRGEYDTARIPGWDAAGTTGGKS